MNLKAERLSEYWRREDAIRDYGAVQAKPGALAVKGDGYKRHARCCASEPGGAQCAPPGTGGRRAAAIGYE